MSIQIQEIQSRIRKAAQEIPPLPGAVMQVLDLVDREDATAEQLQKIISSDPSLSAKVLQLANSAYYGLSRQVSTIQQAVIILGFQTVKNLVLGLAAFQAFKGEKHATPEMLSLWERSFVCAGVALEIAKVKKLGLANAETAFMGGLLHDLGLLFLAQYFPIPNNQIAHAAREDYTRHDTEQKMLGIDHAAIGALIADHWQLPSALVQMIANHHAPYLPDNEYRPLIACVSLASSWVLTANPELNFNFAPPEPPEDAIQWAGIDEAVQQEILMGVAERAQSMRHVMVA